MWWVSSSSFLNLCYLLICDMFRSWKGIFRVSRRLLKQEVCSFIYALQKCINEAAYLISQLKNVTIRWNHDPPKYWLYWWLLRSANFFKRAFMCLVWPWWPCVEQMRGGHTWVSWALNVKGLKTKIETSEAQITIHTRRGGLMFFSVQDAIVPLYFLKHSCLLLQYIYCSKSNIISC